MSYAYKRIKSFEMKAFRQILRVTWTHKRTNDWVLRKAGTEPFLLHQSRKESFLIMVMCYGQKETAWRKKYCKVLLLIKGEEDQKYVDRITKWTGLTSDRLLRSVEDKSQ